MSVPKPRTRSRADRRLEPGVFRVAGRAAAATRGWLCFGNLRLACALGRTGRRAIKREGDGATPIGRWGLIEVFYRADRILPPRTNLPVIPIRTSDGWCDALGDRNYNRREDRLYDIVVVLNYNIVPRVQGKGSAIFMHLARPGYAPTAGCVALSERDMRLFLARAKRKSTLIVPA
jgi:L,D-peptidoglycan transpeptidase YkuD (ErfK/YbiS/YcfS/YnhG family)